MAYKEVLRVEIQEVIRRWQAGGSQRQIGVGTGLSRVTVRKYLAAAMAAGLEQNGPPPDEVPVEPVGAHQPGWAEEGGDSG